MTTERQNLRDFQARLSERLKQAASGSMQAARLGVQIGGQRLLIELSEAGEIVGVPAVVAPVPLTRDWFKGLVNLRGSLYGVADLARFCGGEPTPTTKESRLVALAARLNLNSAILVDRMLGLQNPDAMTEDDAESDAPEALAASGAAGAADASRVSGAAGTSGATDTSAARPPARAPWLGRAWRDADGQRWTELSLARLASDERFLAVAR
ncbi:MAG: chemotaxis protein CheW [Burkholderiaceae bacterium]